MLNRKEEELKGVQKEVRYPQQYLLKKLSFLH
jgi:hypothetical protein